ncbi:hypothetical protein [uncultured Psychrobacter sp.]|uniref:hypothetical protein n=1 Tax=uncultured Psychrobacter sp. TaxID=259303 RepID=UPI0030D80442
MIDKFKKTLLCSALAVLTVACSSNVDDEAPTVDVESEVQATDAATNDVSAEQPEKAPEVQASASKSSMPLEDYIDINDFKDMSYLTKLFLAQTTRELSDEDKLGLMSIEYHNEPDQFKKNDLGKALLPEINKELDKYKGDLGIKIPFGNIYEPYNPYYSTYKKKEELRGGFKNSWAGSEAVNINIRSFDFEKNEFLISQCRYGQYGFSMRSLNANRVSNEQNISIYYLNSAPEQATFTNETFRPNSYEYKYDNLYCGLKFEDQEKAREVEALRVAEKLDTKGFMYYKVTADQNVLIAHPVYAKYTLYNIDTGEDLATRELTWAPRDDI